MSARNSAPLPDTVAVASATDVFNVGDDDGDNWLGCESLHPLTWLPADAVPAALGAVAASAD